MTPIDALFELLQRVESCQGKAVLVNTEELQQWPSAAVKAMKLQRLLMRARPAGSAICPGCEDNCLMPVQRPPSTAGARSSFIVCDKRSDINRVPVSSDRLTQWQCSVDLLCKFIASCLVLRPPARQPGNASQWQIGMASGDQRSQMLCLEAGGILSLVAGHSKVPLDNFIEFYEDRYALNEAEIRRLVDSATTADNRYTPSQIKREARKLKTQELYENWQKAYRELRRRKPGKSLSWYAQQIAKMDIAHKRSPDTIRKNMKK